MPEREFELYLDLLGKLLKLTPEQKTSISDELRDHLEERFEELVQSGQSREDAIRQALDEFGDAAGLAVDFTKVSQKKMRRAIVRTTAVTTAVTALASFLFVYFGPGDGVNEGPGGTVASADPGDSKPAASSVDYLADKELFPEVLERATPLELVDTPLDQVVAFLSDLHELSIEPLLMMPVFPRTNRSHCVPTHCLVLTSKLAGRQQTKRKPFHHFHRTPTKFHYALYWTGFVSRFNLPGTWTQACFT